MKTVHFKEMEKFRGEVVTGIGKFDGVHLGHRVILKTILEESEKTGLTPSVFTFRKFPADFMLCGWEEKLSILKEAGIKICFWCDLNEVMHLSPEKFLNILLTAGVKTLIVGYDFHFGAGRKGDINFLQKMKEEKGFNLIRVPPYRVNGEVVNASEIRNFIKRGDVIKAANFLGRYFSVTGKVIKGSNMGRTLGFPTANLALENNIRIGEGVYAGWALYDKKIYQAAIVIGVSPTFEKTFENGRNKFEVFILGFSGKDIYGEKLRVFLFKKIRNQEKFQDKEKLKVQIENDIKKISSQFLPVSC